MTTNLEASLSRAEWSDVENAHCAIHRVGQNIGTIGAEHHSGDSVRVPRDLCYNGILPQVPDLHHVVDARAHHLARVLIETNRSHLGQNLKEILLTIKTNLVCRVQT